MSPLWHYFYISSALCSAVCAVSGVISSGSFSECASMDHKIRVSGFDFKFSKEDQSLSFRLNGTSSIQSYVKAQINITAYGINAYSKTFDPCNTEYNITMLCPLHAGPYNVSGSVVVPQTIIKDIPQLAFQVPDLQGFVTMSLVAKDGLSLTCINAPVSNGQTLASASVRKITGSVAAGALILSSAVSMSATMTATSSAAGLAGSGGGSASIAITTSPNVGDVFLWFQAVSLNGAFSVAYPAICRSFYKNVGWSVGLVQWQWVQHKIDNFRRLTGGRTDVSSVETGVNRPVATAMTSDRMRVRRRLSVSEHLGSSTSMSKTFQRRDSSPDAENPDSGNHIVEGLKSFVEQLRIPSQNTFMTILLVFLALIVIFSIITIALKAVLDLLHKAKRLRPFWQRFRAGYWSSVTGLILRSILIIYGSWCLFCLYQLRTGDSWAAGLLAGFSLAIFTGILAFLTVRILQIALHKAVDMKGADRLFKHKPYLQKYGILYDQFQTATWWFFIPCLSYSMLKSCIMALGDGHGLFQVVGCMVCEMILLLFILFTRAYESRQANIVNTMICVVRIISLIGTLLFIDILELKETTKTGAGIAIIILQSGTTLILTLLIILNGVLPWLKQRNHKASTLTNSADGKPMPSDQEPSSETSPMLDNTVMPEDLEKATYDNAATMSRASISEYEKVDRRESHGTEVDIKVNSGEVEDASASTPLLVHPPQYPSSR